MEIDFLSDNKKHVISLVGAGGKTTLMYALARACAEQGKKVLVSTTTHIFKPESDVIAHDIEELHMLWKKKSYAVVGAEAENGKLKSLPECELASCMNEADIVLLEADGSKSMPCKVPADHEPAIHERSDIVIAVIGMSALNRPLKDVCFRLDYAMRLLKASDSQTVDEHILSIILSSNEGLKKNVGSREYYAVLNQCDSPKATASARRIAAMLKKNGVSNVCLTSFARAEHKDAFSQ